MAVFYREDDCLELVISVYRMWNAVIRNQHSGIPARGKLCWWIGSTGPHFPGFRFLCCCRYTCAGNSLSFWFKWLFNTSKLRFLTISFLLVYPHKSSIKKTCNWLAVFYLAFTEVTGSYPPFLNSCTTIRYSLRLDKFQWIVLCPTPKICSFLVQGLFIFGFGVPLFIAADATHWGKWTVLFGHALVLSSIYCYILFVHYSKWRDKLPRESNLLHNLFFHLCHSKFYP